ncbi:MAG: AAA family ATPase [Deltaproteobacteria bacterium]|nr:AAA family ATPase [Deltaproteobacteria bacterium]
MYTAFYGLFEKPFSLSPDPRYLFLANAHREALAHLRYGIDQGEGFIAVTGEVGTGKSTLCRAMIEGLGPETEVAFLFNPPRSATELLQAIAQEFGLDRVGHQRHALNDQLNRFLLDRKKLGHRVLLIIDEAQNLDAHVLEEVRLLSNLETSSSKLIQIVLLGQPELDHKLDSDLLRQLRQRISVRWFLTPLSRIETAAYVAHRLQVAAGSRREIFTPGALRELYRRSDGIPRRINLLADRSLLAGYGAGERRIGRSIVRQAAREIEGGEIRTKRPGRVFALRAAAAVGLFLLAGLTGNWVGRSDVLLELLEADSIPTLGLASVAAPGAPSFGGVGGIDVRESVAAPGDSRFQLDADSPVTRLDDTSASSLDELRGIKSLQPGPLGTRGERLRNTLAPGSFLGRLLDHQSEVTSREIAVNSILDSFALDPVFESPKDDEDAVNLLEARGLSVFRVHDATLDSLRALNHPVILVMRSELGDRRTIALRSLDEESALLFGATDRDSLEVPIREIDNQWDGEALIVWETFEEIPQILSPGEQGQGVVWLQRALGELGLYSGAASGLFDTSTERSVRLLQTDALIEPNGTVGPRTQMVLYSKLPRYQVPRLVARGGAG